MEIELNPKQLIHIIKMNSKIDVNKMVEPTTFYPNNYNFQVSLNNNQSCLLLFYNCDFVANKSVMADVIKLENSIFQFHLTRGGNNLIVEKISDNGLNIINILK